MLLFASSVAFSQTTAGDSISSANDSALQQYQKRMDSLDKSAQPQNNLDHNFDYILELQEKQRAKQKRAAMFRIAIGAGLLAVLIIGLRRRRKK